MFRFRKGIAALALTSVVLGGVVLGPAGVAAAASRRPSWLQQIIVGLIVGIALKEFEWHHEVIESTVYYEAKRELGVFGRFLDWAYFDSANNTMCRLVRDGYANALVRANTTVADEDEIQAEIKGLKDYCGVGEGDDVGGESVAMAGGASAGDWYSAA